MNPKEKLAALLKSMQAIVTAAKAEGRDLTNHDITVLAQKNDEAVELKALIARSEKSDALMARLGGMKSDSEPADGAAKSTGPDSWGKKAADALSGLAARVPGGAKALTSGTVGVPSILSPVLIDAHPRRVLDLIPTPDALGNRATPSTGILLDQDSDGVDFVGGSGGMGNGFAFLRQTLRQNNAAAVPDLGAKPASTYTFEQVDDTFRVYANKTEALPWRYLSDFGDLADVLKVQLRDDTLAAIEADVLTGDGTDDAFTGILETSGVQVQAFDSDLLTTLSAAKYKLLGQDRALTGWALNPADIRALEMLRENGTTGAFLFKTRADLEGFLGAPVVPTLGLPAGQAIAADWTQSELLPYGDDELVFDGTQRTVNNTFLLMFEGRYGFRIKKPFDFVSVALAV